LIAPEELCDQQGSHFPFMLLVLWPYQTVPCHQQQSLSTKMAFSTI